ncbi:hypothetical protein [Oceanicoccus sagamiensis]|nr:hypothetical protein [Oceanicoccus sagamiensis]
MYKSRFLKRLYKNMVTPAFGNNKLAIPMSHFVISAFFLVLNVYGKITGEIPSYSGYIVASESPRDFYQGLDHLLWMAMITVFLGMILCVINFYPKEKD